jgi:predicted dehydrogenase
MNKIKGRRGFVKNGLLGAAAFTIIPRYVLGGKGYIAPSDKLNLAAIGAGGKGWSDIENAYNKGANNVVALCDVDRDMAKRAIEKWPNARYFYDFREMIEKMKGSIDAVTVSTPDHVHGIAAMAAMQSGMHVYVQKPLTHNIKEARTLTEAARKYKIVSQMGNQGASHPGQEQIQKWIDKGELGKVSEVFCWTNRPVWPQGIAVPTEKKDLPSSMSKDNWDLWIGPADYVDYHPLYHPFKWRGWWNFGTGALGDMGCHIIDIPFKALQLGYPTEVEASVGQVFTKDWTPEYIPDGCPPSSNIQLKFPGTKKSKTSEIKMTWTDGGIKPFHPDLIPASVDIIENGIIMIGDKGTLICDYFGANPRVFKKDKTVLEMPKDFKSKNKYLNLPEFGHQVAWADAVKAGFDSKEHKALTSSFDYSGPMTEAVIMGNLAIRSYTVAKMKDNKRVFDGRKKLLWDGANMKVTNYDEANQYVSRNYREGWKLI